MHGQILKRSKTLIWNNFQIHVFVNFQDIKMWICFHKLTKTSITRRQTLPKGHLNKKKTQSIFTSHALAFQYSTFETASPSGIYPIHLHVLLKVPEMFYFSILLFTCVHRTFSIHLMFNPFSFIFIQKWKDRSLQVTKQWEKNVCVRTDGKTDRRTDWSL